MTQRAKKDRVSKWDTDENNENTLFNDDQDDYISERSSTVSLGEHAPPTKPDHKQEEYPEPNQEEYQDPYYTTGEGQHTLRYYYNELPEGGVPAATQVKETKKEAKLRQKEELKARRGQGALVQGPDTGPPVEGDNYFPYWYYYKVKNPDWIMRQQRYADGQFMPPVDPTKKIEPIDPAELPEVPKLTLAAMKARNYVYTGRDTPDMRYNQKRQRYEMIGKNGLPQGETGDENDGKQRSTSRQYIPLKDGDNDERLMQNGRQTRTDQRAGKLNTEYDWNDHYLQYMRSKSSLGLNGAVNYKPNIRVRSRRGKNRDPLDGLYGDDPSANADRTNTSFTNVGGGGGRRIRGYKSNVYHDGPNAQSRRTYDKSSDPQSNQPYNNSSGPYSNQQYNNPNGPRSNQQYNNSNGPRSNQHRSGPYSNQHHSDPHSNQHHSAPHTNQKGQHHHGHSQHNNLTSNDRSGGNLKVVDASFKKSKSTNPFQHGYDSSNYSQPGMYNQNSFLPPITNSYPGGSYPGSYYDDSKILPYRPTYKYNQQTKFYDRYLNNVIDKRLFT